jgi:hypothetical protein
LSYPGSYNWDEEQEISFQTLQQKLLSKPILQYPAVSKLFMLMTDARNEDAGTVQCRVKSAKIFQ